jgi:hypothetical protein
VRDKEEIHVCLEAVIRGKGKCVRSFHQANLNNPTIGAPCVVVVDAEATDLDHEEATDSVIEEDHGTLGSLVEEVSVKTETDLTLETTVDGVGVHKILVSPVAAHKILVSPEAAMPTLALHIFAASKSLRIPGLHRVLAILVKVANKKPRRPLSVGLHQKNALLGSDQSNGMIRNSRVPRR